LIDDLESSTSASALKELKSFQDQDQAIKAIEARIKETKTTLKEKTNELDLKLTLKRIGGDDFKAENRELIKQVDVELARLNADKKDGKKKIAALNKDKEALATRIAKTDALLKSIGGQLTEEQARRLILKKLYDIARAELERYLNAEKRVLVQAIENLWDKYAVSNAALETNRANTLSAITEFFKGLGYAE
jgi:type I restriction enzyme M protein